VKFFKDKSPVFLSFLILSFLSGQLNAQELPLLTQNLTGAALYNPASSGFEKGTFSVGYRDTFSQMPSAPQTLVLSGASPLIARKIGISANAFHERVNFLSNTLLNLGFSYKIYQTKYNSLSAGISTELTCIRVRDDTNFEGGNHDPVLLYNNGRLNRADFGLGFYYQSQYIDIMLAAGRISSGWRSESKNLTTNLFASVRGKLPLFLSTDLFEPYVSLTRLSTSGNLISAGFFYTCFDLISIGIGYTSTDAVAYSLSVSIDENISVGYSIQDHFNSNGGLLGDSHELILKVEFNRGSKAKLPMNSKKKQKRNKRPSKFTGKNN
jgi:type IX secretion system PorP/SprF family membrane protein